MLGICVLFIRFIIRFEQYGIGHHHFLVHERTAADRSCIFIERSAHTQYQLRRFCQVNIDIRTDRIFHQADIRIKIISFIDFHVTIVFRHIGSHIITGNRSTTAKAQIGTLVGDHIVEHGIIPVRCREDIGI